MTDWVDDPTLTREQRLARFYSMNPQPTRDPGDDWRDDDTLPREEVLSRMAPLPRVQISECCDQAYVCPTSGELECAVHGGFDRCCDDPECPGYAPIGTPIFDTVVDLLQSDPTLNDDRGEETST